MRVVRWMMRYTIRTAVKADEYIIRKLFQEMLRTIYDTEDVKGYEDGDLDRFFAGKEDRIYVAEDGLWKYIMKSMTIYISMIFALQKPVGTRISVQCW